MKTLQWEWVLGGCILCYLGGGGFEGGSSNRVYLVWVLLVVVFFSFLNLLLRPERFLIFLTPSQAKYCQQIPSTAAEYSMPASWTMRNFTTAQPLLAVLACSHPPSLLLIQQGPPFQKLPTLDPHHGPPPPQEGRAQVTTASSQEVNTRKGNKGQRQAR